MKSICVIDDDQIYQMIVRKIIEKSEVFEEITSYVNCQKALKKLKCSNTTLPSVILLDINMPEMDGWQFLECLISSRPNLCNETSIYIVTSSIAYSDRDKAGTYKEVSGFISKPLTVSRLVKIGEECRIL